MQTATQTEQTNVGGVNLTGLPVEGAAVPQLNLVPQDEAAAAALKAKQAEAELAELKKAQEVRSQALARFEAAPFQLDTEVVGQRAWGKKVTKSGAVKVAMGSKKELGVMSGGLSGDDLVSWTRMRKDELKAEQSLLATKLQAEPGWTGGGYSLNAKGNKIVIEYTKCSPVTVGLAEPTEEQACKKLDLTIDEYRALKAMKAAAAEAKKAADEAKAADAQAAKELAEEEAALAAMGDSTKSDNDTE